MEGLIGRAAMHAAFRRSASMICQNMDKTEALQETPERLHQDHATLKLYVE